VRTQLQLINIIIIILSLKQIMVCA